MAAQKGTSKGTQKGTQKGKQSKTTRKTPAKTQAAITKRRKSSPFPFFELPAELRNTIYHYSLVDTNGIYLVSRSKAYRRVVKRRLLSEHPQPAAKQADDDQQDPNQRDGSDFGSEASTSEPDGPPANSSLNNLLAPNLLRVCRQIYDEAAPMLYTQNELFVKDTTCLHTFLAQTGRERERIHYITVQAWGSGRGVHNAMNHVAFMMLAGAVNLRRLRVGSMISWWSKPDMAALQFYRDAHYWLEAVGTRAGDMTAGVKVISFPDPQEKPSAEQNQNMLYYRRWGGLKNTQESYEKFRKELVRLLNNNS